MIKYCLPVVMLVYLGLICGENMQIEGFWYYLFTGVFEAATIHYAVAKLFGSGVIRRNVFLAGNVKRFVRWMWI